MRENHRANGGSLNSKHVITMQESGQLIAERASPVKRANHGEDLAGRKFGRLTAIQYHSSRGYSHLWECRCDCGNEKIVYAGNLRSGYTASCGCYRNERIIEANQKYGGTKKGPFRAEYRTWGEMKTRCFNKNRPGWEDYGGRGIKVCERWMSFENFLSDMGKRPSDVHSIDRIDNNGDYEPGNCRWSTSEEQGSNKRNNVIVEITGAAMTAARASRRAGLPNGAVASRLRKGWTEEQAITIPIGGRRK